MKKLLMIPLGIAALLAFMVAPAIADTTVDSWGPGSLNGCSVDSYGTNYSAGSAAATLHSDSNCGVTECIRLSYVYNGSSFWAGEACDNGALGATASSSVGPCSPACTYLGRQIRISSTCYWDTVFDNPTSHACI